MVKDSTEKNPPPTKLIIKRHWRWIVGGLVLLLLLGFGIALANYMSLGTTKVPNVVGKTLPIAGEYLKEAKLNPNPVVTYEFNDKIEKDRIIDQEPKAEIQVKTGREIKVVISKGPEYGVFPDVTTGQLSKENAAIQIQNAGFTGKVTYDTKPSSNVPKDAVVAQDPASGSSWPKNSDRIRITISSGPEFYTINMPYVIGKTSTDAKAILEQNKLDVKVENEASGAIPVDVVIRTTPNPGESVQQGTSVTLFVSSGLGPLADDAKAILAQSVSVASKNGKIKTHDNGNQ